MNGLFGRRSPPALVRSGAMGAEERLAELGVTLPAPMAPGGNYVPVVRTGSLVFCSGAGPIGADGSVVTGKVGADVDLEQARHAARLTGLQLLAVLRAELGSLNRVVRVVKLLGMVNCAPGFNRTPEVINGCSELLIEVFGDAGRHARSAVGMAELPRDISVEIELVAEVEPEG
jgi:enamine deaminase RidA (YjgF/YER057c/UK114 family)